ncbi:MAG TPA: glycosyltransferase family 9 protein, partial [Ilumatobacteraceae bacterium]
MFAAQRIAVVRALPGLGDMLCLVPALRSLRAGAPDAQITVVGLPSTQWMIDRFPKYIDAFLPIGAWAGLPETGNDHQLTRRTLAAARGSKFDLAIQLHGTGWYVNDLTEALGARCNAGHFPEGEPPPDGKFRPWPEFGHEIHRLASLVRWLGYPDAGDHLEFDRLDSDESSPAIRDLAGAPYVVIHPGASREDRRWVADGFAGVVAALAERGIRSLISGSRTELDLASSVAHASPVSPLVIAGTTSLGSLSET